jgi:hypothetical protein
LQNNLDFAAIVALDLAWWREPVGYRYSQTLKRNKDEVGLRSYFSFAAGITGADSM